MRRSASRSIMPSTESPAAVLPAALRAPHAEEFKPKIDLSHISKPGDVLKAITQKAAQPCRASASRWRQLPLCRPGKPSRRPRLCRRVLRAAVAKPPAVTASAAPMAPVETPKPAPRLITPQTVARPPAAVVVPPKPPLVPPPAPTAVAPSHQGSTQATRTPGRRAGPCCG